jgi:hypothetical protein
MNYLSIPNQDTIYNNLNLSFDIISIIKYVFYLLILQLHFKIWLNMFNH